MTSTDGCYCGLAEKETSMLRCDACKKFFHRSCLKSGPPSPLEGDIFFQFVCSRCSSNGDEEVERMKLQWLQVVMLSLYNLQLSGMGKYGYFRWKEHICAFIDSHWTTFFGFSRKKTSLWHGTVAGTLSTGCPGYFLSGGEELNEPGWWRLAEMKPPSLKLEPPGRHCRKQKVEKEQPIKVESLRSRRGKTSIQAAIELKVKRSTLTEAKEIRKSRGAGRNWESSFNSEDRSMSNDCLTPSPQSGVKGHSEGDRKFAAVTASAGSSSQVAVKVEPMDDVAMETDSPTETGHSYASLPHSSSRGDLEEDTSSQLSHASSKTDVYLTEKDLWAVGTVPQYLLKDDEEDENDSDLEIDPGTFSPPRTDSPIVMSQSPTLQDIYASIHDSSGQTDNTDLSTDDKTFHPVKIKEEDAESELSSSSEESRAVTDSTDNSERRTQDKNKLKDDFSVDKEPEIKFIAMSQYEESELLRRLQQATGVSTLEPDLARLRRKLIVRQLQRQHGQRVFNLDLEVRRSLGQLQHLDSKQLDWHHLNPDRLPMSRSSTTEVRVLDRFQVPHYQRRLLQAGPSSFLTRLLGTEDHQLQPISSPYTARTLKPFIRRDYESRPLKLRLLEEIRAFPHRKTADWTAPGGYPIDYCYVRPEHIPSVNTLCRQFFWPGIDLSECLQYPDFSCVVLYRKVVIGFAFMVPDTKYNEAYISFIFSHPEWRRCGIATFMLYHLIQTCMGKDVTLHVSVTNSAMLLYQKFGFKPEEFILDFYDKYYPVESDVCKHAFLLRLQR